LHDCFVEPPAAASYVARMKRSGIRGFLM